MSYIALARRWRPRSFDDLIGQDAVVKTLKNAISSNRIVHAYLFSGPRGVGKTSSARILAKALNCEDRKAADPCDKCSNCDAITKGASVDVIEIDGASNNSVDAVRELRETVKYAPSAGRYKIYIIDEVHMLSQSAFNALLKTLEEPPSHVVFVFATTEPRKIPATILSRCQHHAFRRIPRVTITKHITTVAEAEKIKITDQAIDIIARAADGSIRDSLTLLDQAAAFSDTITGEELQKLMGLPDSEVIRGMTAAILNADMSRCLSMIKELSDRGSDLRQITRELLEHFRDIAMVKLSDSAESLLEMGPDETRALREDAADVSMEQLTLMLSELLKIDAELRSASNPRYMLELGILRMSFVKGMISIDTILNKLGDSGSTKPDPADEISSGNKGKTVRDAGTDPKRKAASVSDSKLWDKLIERVEARDHLLATKLSEAKVVKVQKDELSIGFNGGMSFLAESVKKQSTLIKPILKEISGRNLRLKILSLPGLAEAGDRQSIKEEAASAPIVQEALKRFNSSVIRIKALNNDTGSGGNPDSDAD